MAPLSLQFYIMKRHLLVSMHIHGKGFEHYFEQPNHKTKKKWETSPIRNLVKQRSFFWYLNKYVCTKFFPQAVNFMIMASYLRQSRLLVEISFVGTQLVAIGFLYRVMLARRFGSATRIDDFKLSPWINFYFFI